MSKKHRRHRQIPQQEARTQYLLDQFTEADVDSWKEMGRLVNDFEIVRYHVLEAIRQSRKSELIEALASHSVRNVDLAAFCRIVDYQYSMAPLSSRGSLIGGGRFNIGRDCDQSSAANFPALYAATSHRTALLEKFGQPAKNSPLEARDLALRPHSSYSFVQLEGHVREVLILDDSRQLKAFAKIISEFQLPEHVLKLAARAGYGQDDLLVLNRKVLFRTLLDPGWRFLPSQFGVPSNPQIFGAMIREAGFQGIMYPSARGGDRCMAVFPENLEGTDSAIRITPPHPEGLEHAELNASTWRELI
jgi:hypothetical protein